MYGEIGPINLVSECSTDKNSSQLLESFCSSLRSEKVDCKLIHIVFQKKKKRKRVPTAAANRHIVSDVFFRKGFSCIKSDKQSAYAP